MSTLLKLTKAQLIDLVKDRNAEVQGLRAALGDAKHDLARLAPQRTIKFADGRPPRTLPAKFAAARAAAMAGNCVVLV